MLLQVSLLMGRRNKEDYPHHKLLYIFNACAELPQSLRDETIGVSDPFFLHSAPFPIEEWKT